MESASAPHQSLRAAGLKPPEGLSASGAEGVTRGAMVGDQSLSKAVRGVVVDQVSALYSSSCSQRLGVQALDRFAGIARRGGRVCLLRLPLMRYGVTSLGAMSLTLWPWAANCRAQRCAPAQPCRPHQAAGLALRPGTNSPQDCLCPGPASMPMVHSGKAANTSLSLPRPTLGWRS